jgi:hypothetical protein
MASSTFSRTSRDATRTSTAKSPRPLWQGPPSCSPSRRASRNSTCSPTNSPRLLTFKAKHGHEGNVEQFLRDAKAFVDEEPETTAWFAIHLEDGHYGIFDVFPDHGGRFKHLTGRVAQDLAKHALTLLGSLPDPELPNVLAENFNQ